VAGPSSNNFMRIKNYRRFALKLVLLASAAFGPTVFAADTLDLAQYRGKLVLIDFWASWCAPCRYSFPWLNEMQAKYADRGLVVVGVNVDRERADAEHFLRDVPAHFRIVYDPSGTLAAAYDVPGMPTSFVFGADGKLIGKHIGFQQGSRAEREAELQKLLPPPARSN
jgi:thiol-disulfide isomerase/thioredoxin